ncbi:terpene synthase metal binding domain protein [Histoplasma capsulatum G186AR]|uniref:Terpene synthase metal binding domain protein n=1 Tax=Ajellomyces capsulatus TaxID=5037 RepID=A0A8H8CT75_AJECA|nr:terpene synthase metal binding domain protein [Histoplasma capsulatum]QSS73275.1 terpene synthase metal binding domain protein [Histoplasma capsulatum G186AR]
MQLQRLYSVFRQDKIISRFSRASVPFQIPRTVARNTNFFSTAATGELQSTVTIPDLFVSFLAQKPVPNPSYAKVKWSQEVSMRNGRECYYPKRAQADFAYFAALLAPKAAEPEYQTICDYISWIFYFDDMFDDGPLSNDPLDARRELDGLLAVMASDGDVVLPDNDRSKLVFQSIWKRIIESSTKA